MNIKQQGNKILVEFYIREDSPAYKLSDGRMINASQTLIDIDKRPGSFLLTKDPGVQFGHTRTEGSAVVEIDIRELESLANRASRNQNKARPRPSFKAGAYSLRRGSENHFYASVSPRHYTVAVG